MDWIMCKWIAAENEDVVGKHEGGAGRCTWFSWVKQKTKKNLKCPEQSKKQL